MGKIINIWFTGTRVFFTSPEIWPWCVMPALGVLFLSSTLFLVAILSLAMSWGDLFAAGVWMGILKVVGLGSLGFGVAFLLLFFLGPLTGLIMCVFNSRLMEQVLKKLGVPTVVGHLGYRELLSLEIKKLAFLAPTSLLAIVISLIPLFGKPLSLLFLGVVLTYNYADYALELNNFRYSTRKDFYRKHYWMLGFTGLPLAVLSAFPIVNAIAIPWAICIAGAFVKEFHGK